MTLKVDAKRKEQIVAQDFQDTPRATREYLPVSVLKRPQCEAEREAMSVRKGAGEQELDEITIAKKDFERADFFHEKVQT